MTLAEKLVALRGEWKLSQGDLAEKLDVSRQSVSKWETGQAVPELDKIIKLADLFGVTVDELVRDGEKPRPERSETAEPQVIYVERPQKRYTPRQALGILLIAGGLVMMLMMFLNGTMLFIGAAVLILGLPFLLAKKHPFLIVGWLVWLAGCLVLYNPYLTGTGWMPLNGFAIWWRWITNWEEYIRDSPVALLLASAFLGVSLLTVALPLYTGWLGFKKWKGRKESKPEETA